MEEMRTAKQVSVNKWTQNQILKGRIGTGSEGVLEQIHGQRSLSRKTTEPMVQERVPLKVQGSLDELKISAAKQLPK